MSVSSADWNRIAFANAKGARMAYETGAVEWATLFGGPEAGAAVVVAAAALCSGNAYYVITHH